MIFRSKALRPINPRRTAIGCHAGSAGSNLGSRSPTRSRCDGGSTASGNIAFRPLSRSPKRRALMSGRCGGLSKCNAIATLVYRDFRVDGRPPVPEIVRAKNDLSRRGLRAEPRRLTGKTPPLFATPALLDLSAPPWGSSGSQNRLSSYPSVTPFSF
jgi:hypothetical protein